MNYTLNNFYQSKEWTAFRKTVIFDRLNEQGETICEHCGKPIVRAYDIILHHKIHLTDGNVNNAEISLNPDNIMLVHHACHNRIHNKLGYVYKQVFLVYGSPFSGKSTFVRENQNVGDLIVDMDNIWQCISGCDRYVKPDRLKSNAFGIRDALLEQVRFRRGGWNNAYIIGGYPLIGERERLMKSLSAREIYIDCSYEECLARLKACSDGRDYSEWKRYIDDWWRKYLPPPLPVVIRWGTVEGFIIFAESEKTRFLGLKFQKRRLPWKEKRKLWHFYAKLMRISICLFRSLRSFCFWNSG